ncbi:MAG TPA: bifunctional methionine sulfoxide reductase B/A protein [Candidatus Heimdallarchaeota archaeon]|nr:bifunctional methionine sulfoxide reductase B/A protein [Candidatus Heimdallarchaeota archaeon]
MSQKIGGIIVIMILFIGWNIVTSNARDNVSSELLPDGEIKMVKKVIRSEEEWKEILTPEQYRVLRKSGTERAFTGQYNDFYEEGVYICAACSTPLFSSGTKYNHGTGWPSFTAVLEEYNVEYRADYSLLMKRTEVRCGVCGSHLGHVFDDGPSPTHKHFCINSVALDFTSKDTGSTVSSTDQEHNEENKIVTETATFAAGCFWGVEHKFGQLKGVLSTTVGYSGGEVKNPSYKQVCSNETGHAEAVHIIYDPAEITYEDLVAFFFKIHDATQINRQGLDVGSQYRSAIFYHDDTQKKTALKVIEDLNTSGRYKKPITTQVVPYSEFYKAEEYHQKYYDKLRKK